MKAINARSATRMAVTAMATVVFALTLTLALGLGYGQSTNTGASTNEPAPAKTTKPADPPKTETSKPATHPPAHASAPASAYTPSTDEQKDLTIAQLAAQLAQSQYFAKAQALPEFGQFQQKMTVLQQECTKVKLANHWPEAVQCDVQQVPVRFCLGQLPCPSESVKQ